MAIEIDVVTQLDEKSAQTSARQIERQFQQASSGVRSNFESETASAFETMTRGAEKSSASIQRAMNRAADASGRVRVEHARYDEIVARGDAPRSRMIRQAEQLERARRNEAQAVRRVADEYRKLASTQTVLSSFGSGLSRGIPFLSSWTSELNEFEGTSRKAGYMAGRALGTAFTVAAGGLIGAAGYTLFKGFERYQAIDQATSRLQNLNRTMEATGKAGFDIQAVMDTVNKSILDTPFAMDQAFSIATRALSSNTGDLERFMTVTADAAGFAGASIEDIGEALLKIANKGKVSMEEVGNELRNIPILPWLQEQLNVSGAALSKMISDGKVGLDDLMRAIEVNASGFAKAAGDTIAGAMSNAQTAVARLGANFLGAIFGKPTDEANTLKDAVKALTERLNDVNTWVTAHQDDIRRFFEQAVRAAQDVAQAIQTVIGWLDKMDIGVGDVVKAFVAWKTISGVSALASKLGGISTTLSTTLPNAAATGAAGISAALNRVAIPVWLTMLMGNEIANRLEPHLDPTPDPGTGNRPWYWPIERGLTAPGRIWDQTFGDGPPAEAPDPFRSSSALESMLLPGGAPSQAAHMPPIPGAGQHWDPARGWVSDSPTTPGPSGAPILPPSGAGDETGSGRSGPRLPAAPVVPYAAAPALDPRLRMDPGLFSAQTSVADAATRLAEKEARLNQLRADNNATAQDILNAQNDVAKAQREKTEADMRFAEAQQRAFEQQGKQLNKMTGTMSDIGAQLDSDFGISGGLSGMADNVVRFLGAIALAGPMAHLSAISDARGDEGSGLVGILASTGALGPQFLPSQPTASDMGPAALRPSGSYPGDAALLANVPAGRYTQEARGDLTQGLADCSSAVEDLVNLMDGRPTGGASMSTHNAAQWLTERGFLPGLGGLGDFRVGFNSGHMQATLPGGTPFNWGSDAAAARGGVGGTGADDPSFTSHYYRPAGAGFSAGLSRPPAGALGSSGGGPVPVFVVNMPGGGALGPVSLPVGPGGPAAPSIGPAPLGGSVGEPLTSPGALPGLNIPANTSPGLNNPAAPGAPLPPLGSLPGGGSLLPGTGMPGAAPLSSGGQAYPAQPGGGGIGLGGMAMDGLMAATSGLDMLAPGSGAAAKIGIQLANLGIKQAGKVAGIATSGVFETLSLGDNPMGSLGKSWFGKLAGGLAGARPATPNAAGQAAPAMDSDKDPRAARPQGAQAGNGGDTNITVNNNRQTEDGTGRDIAWHVNSPPGRHG